MQRVDLSGTIYQVVQAIATWFGMIIQYLKNIYVLPHVNALTLLVVATIMGMVISAIFVRFEADEDE